MSFPSDDDSNDSWEHCGHNTVDWLPSTFPQPVSDGWMHWWQNVCKHAGSRCGLRKGNLHTEHVAVCFTWWNRASATSPSDISVTSLNPIVTCHKTTVIKSPLNKLIYNCHKSDNTMYFIKLLHKRLVTYLNEISIVRYVERKNQK